jgi:hypothetical protein
LLLLVWAFFYFLKGDKSEKGIGFFVVYYFGVCLYSL